MGELELKAGDHVEWHSSQGKVKGVVRKKLASKTGIKSHKVAASPENPEYLVTSDGTGKQAAHRPDEMKRSPKSLK